MAGENGIVSGMAGRYATALFELALETNSVDPVQSDLKAFDALVASTGLQSLVRAGVLATSMQSARRRARQGRFRSKESAASGRGEPAAVDVDLIIRDLTGWSCAKGRGDRQVTVPMPSDARMNEIRDALKAVTGKDVRIDVEVDPAIIGGLKVKVGSRMVDASLRTKLNSIKFAMKEAR